MAAVSTQARSPAGGLAFSKDTQTVVTTLLKYLGLMLANAFGLVIFYTFLWDDNLGLALVTAVITLGANVIFFVPGLYPIRWMTPGLMLVTLLVVYPIVYTVLTAFTNYGDGHLLTKQQMVNLVERRRFVPENAIVYDWTLYQSESGEYALWLTREHEDGSLQVAFAPVGEPIDIIEDPTAEPPEVYEGYTQLDRAARTQALGAVQNLVFGEGDDTAGIRNRNQAARPLSQLYTYDAATDTITDNQTGRVYRADNVDGFFIPVGGTRADALAPGYRVNVGLNNFARFINDPNLRQPLVDIFVWTVVFAFMSVMLTFVAGLFMAIILNDPIVPGTKLIRSLLIIPYAIPGVIGILVWRGMLNENLGLITNAIAEGFGIRIPWFSNAIWAKIAILMVNLWLGYPYMMLICSGALQAIPGEIYEAAAVDGAKPYQRFWNITLPLLLVTVGPLLIASFVFNFNNYLMIELLTRGSPPIPGSPVPAGYTDILISYTYRIAFGSDRGADYGYASAITIIIFLVVVSITLFQYRFTKAWEEVGENV